jgi:hypothetical protein
VNETVTSGVGVGRAGFPEQAIRPSNKRRIRNDFFALIIFSLLIAGDNTTGNLLLFQIKRPVSWGPGISYKKLFSLKAFEF